MKEFDHIEKMREQGILSEEQARMLSDSVKESNQRKTGRQPAESKNTQPPSIKKFLIVSGILFFFLFAALVLNSGNKPLFFLLLLVLITFGCLAVVLLIMFNTLAWKKEGIARTLALMVNEMDRKDSLVPQIWECIGKFSTHESGIHEKVTLERSQSAGKSASGDRESDRSSSAIEALVEDYPEIKSDRNFQQLFDQLVETENRITAITKWHNHNAGNYNGLLETFPFSAVALIFSFDKATYC